MDSIWKKGKGGEGDDVSAAERKHFMQLWGLKVFMSYDDMSNLVATSSVVTALILSFSIALATVPERETFDWPNWREAMYDSEKFRDFAIFTLEQESYNFTVQLDRDLVIDTRAFVEDFEQEFSGVAYGGTDEMEMVLELWFAVFPSDRARAYLARLAGSSEVGARLSVTSNFYYFTSSSNTLLVSALVGGIALYISLCISPCQFDDSGAALQAWSRAGLPITFMIYVINIIALILFLTALSAFVTTSDHHLVEATPFNWAMLLGLAVPLAAIYVSLSIFSVFATQRTVASSSKVGHEDAEGEGDAETGTPQKLSAATAARARG